MQQWCHQGGGLEITDYNAHSVRNWGCGDLPSREEKIQLDYKTGSVCTLCCFNFYKCFVLFVCFLNCLCQLPQLYESSILRCRTTHFALLDMRWFYLGNTSKHVQTSFTVEILLYSGHASHSTCWNLSSASNGLCVPQICDWFVFLFFLFALYPLYKIDIQKDNKQPNNNDNDNCIKKYKPVQWHTTP